MGPHFVGSIKRSPACQIVPDRTLNPIAVEHAVAPRLDCQPRRDAWVAMQVQTKFLRLFKEVAISDHIDGWRVCWIGGWDKWVLFVVMVEKRLPAKRSSNP
jgi:hypothetical protein